MAVDWTRLEALAERSQALQAELDALDTEFQALIAEGMAGGPDDRARAQRALAGWVDADVAAEQTATLERASVQNWMVGG